MPPSTEGPRRVCGGTPTGSSCCCVSQRVDGVDYDELVLRLEAPDEVLNLQHQVLQHGRALDERRVVVLLGCRRTHHYVRDAVDEVNPGGVYVERLEYALDRLRGDRRGDIDRVHLLAVGVESSTPLMTSR